MLKRNVFKMKSLGLRESEYSGVNVLENIYNYLSALMNE